LPHHIEVLQERHKIQHIVSLIHGDWLSDFYQDSSIHIHKFPFLGRYIPPEMVKEIIGLIHSFEEPVAVHCLKGKTRTGKILAANDIVHHNISRFAALMRNTFQ